jgi:hypothetical protein
VLVGQDVPGIGLLFSPDNCHVPRVGEKLLSGQ